MVDYVAEAKRLGRYRYTIRLKDGTLLGRYYQEGGKAFVNTVNRFDARLSPSWPTSFEAQGLADNLYRREDDEKPVVIMVPDYDAIDRILKDEARHEGLKDFMKDGA